MLQVFPLATPVVDSFCMSTPRPYPWKRYDMETLSALLSLCDGNPPFKAGLPSQRNTNIQLWCYLWCEHEQTVQQTMELPVIWGAMTLIWRHCTDWVKISPSVTNPETKISPEWRFVETHYNGVIMGAMASLITSLTIVYLTVYSGTDERKHQSSASLAFVWGIHRWLDSTSNIHEKPDGMFNRKLFLCNIRKIFRWRHHYQHCCNGTICWHIHSKWLTFCRRYFNVHFLNKRLVFWFGVQWILFLGLQVKICQHMDRDDGLSRNKQQTVVWTSHYLIHRYSFAAQRFSEFSLYVIVSRFFLSHFTHWGRDEMDNISKMTFSNVFSSMKMFEFRLRSHWSLFLMVRLTIFQHCFR